MDNKQIAHDFVALTDSPSNIREWTQSDNRSRRTKASLDKRNDTGIRSGRYHAERVLALKEKGAAGWSDHDYKFARRVVNYAKRSGGISAHHPHAGKSEIAGTGMTKNEIARRNWGLPRTP